MRLPRNYHYLVRLTFIFFFIQTLCRVVLILDNPPGLIDFADNLFDGFLWDIYAWIFLSLPLFIISAFLPERIVTKFDQSKISYVLTWFFTTVWTFVAFCEFNFWREFHSRFNFIAVDYLIYTNEVLANIRESFPMGWIMSGVFLVACLITYLSLKIRISIPKKVFLKKSTSLTLFCIITPVLFFNILGPFLESHDPNFHDDQLARNGWIEFARAFRSNKIDYKAFYQTVPDKEAETFVLSKKIPLSPVENPFRTKPNVVLIVVESLGAKFIAPLGGQKDTTPFLNKLADESIFFENLYANGTRTVRGLEALNLSIPPTPGYAVVKRPDHKNLYSMGNTFLKNGYDPTFLYGGRGFFDNMNSFFKGNGFSVIDQNDYKKNEVTFTNAWGVCDEDLFAKATQIMDEKHSSKPTLLFMLTTSNHRPFTYPNGKIDIPSGESRAGAVKYTDFAIGKFLTDVKNKKWAKNTIFIVVADHSTEGRGQFDLEMVDFHIPMWIYAPGAIKPKKISKLVSQIDLLPSLIHLLGLKDQSPFFGQSFFNENWKEERAFVGNYQYVGFYKDNILTTLGPNRKVRNFGYDPVIKTQEDLAESPFVPEAASYYQYASELLATGRYKSGPP
jgi:phosphoglycerol transferase MdoB-like AlkP superfamily enzyme